MTALNVDSAQQNDVSTSQNEKAVSQKAPDQIVTENINTNPTPAETEVKSTEKAEDPDWRAFREARKKDRAAREAAEQQAREKAEEVAALKAAMEAAFSSKAPSTQAYQQYYGMNQEPEETEEQRIERKVNELLTKKEQDYAKQQAEREQKEFPLRLKREFPDFTQICSQENLDYLDYHYPEVSRPLQRLQDGYDKWSDIYRAVKKFIPNAATAKQESIKADINANKPKSMSTNTASPTGERNTSSYQDIEARRAARWEEMKRLMKGV